MLTQISTVRHTNYATTTNGLIDSIHRKAIPTLNISLVLLQLLWLLFLINVYLRQRPWLLINENSFQCSVKNAAD